MQSAQSAPAEAIGNIVFHKAPGQPTLFEFALRKRRREETALVFKAFGFDDVESLQPGLIKNHEHFMQRKTASGPKP